MAPDTLPPGPFRIGQVTEHTGLSASTIRTWERRYQVVTPRRTDKGTRLYSQQELHRLRLIKQLTDTGEAVGVLAELDDDALQQRLSPAQTQRRPERPRVVLLHRSLVGAHPDDPVEVVSSSRSVDGVAADTAADVVVVELELLGLDPVSTLIALRKRLRQARPLVLAAFVPRSTRASLEAAGAMFMRAPATREDVLSRCRTMAPPQVQPHTEPLFDRATLQYLLEVRPENPCECPTHLASLALSIQAFEEYSRQCVQMGGADTILHTELAEESAVIRVRVEALLRLVCAHDGITLPIPVDASGHMV
jgi:DNA-binding transcriptional MerR regulator